MTAIDDLPPKDMELYPRTESLTAVCTICHREQPDACDMDRYPPKSKTAPQTYHPQRLARARQGW